MTTPGFHVVLAGGGTGGHLFPGLAVAEELQRAAPGVRITFAGSGKAFEQRLVGQEGYEHLALPCRPMPRSIRDALSFVVANLAGGRASRRFIGEQSVDVVVGLGGYASVPMARAAGQRRVPLVLLEQNAVPGRATRWLARSAWAICLAMPAARQLLPPSPRVLVTGNPVRGGFVAGTRRVPEFVRHTECAGYLLVLGGSGGARALNENVPKAIYRLGSSIAGWHIVHQTGEADAEVTASLYRKLGLSARVEAFLADMPSVLRHASLAVCRAGGTTLAELSAARVPAVLVPYPHAADDHQRRNAEVYCGAGAALLVDEREPTGRFDHRLADALRPAIVDAAIRRSMSLAMQRLARPRAARDVAALVLELAQQRASANLSRRAA